MAKSLTRVIENAQYSRNQACRAELAIAGGGEVAYIGGPVAGLVLLLLR